MADRLDVRTDYRNGVARVALTGELDMSTVSAVEHTLDVCRADRVEAVIVDLRGLSFLDSSGLHAFLRARNDADENGHRLHLVSASRPARVVFEVTETAFLLDEPEAFCVLDRFS